MVRSSMNPRLRQLSVGVLLLLVALPAIQPLLKGALPESADGLLHFHRLGQLDRALRHGNLFPRWAPDMGYGFGFPLLNYYAPLSYYTVAPLRLVGLSTQATLLTAFVLALLVASVGAYLVGRDLFGPRAGFIAAVAFVYAPYTLFNVIHRGALTEAWGLAWLPLTFWAMRRSAVRGRRVDFGLSTLFFGALVLTHNILALVSTPLVIVYAAVLWNLHGRGRPRGVRLAASLALGLGLAAFFWAPAFFERDYVQIHQLYALSDLDFRNNFITLRDLLVSPRPVDPALVKPSIPYGLGWPQVGLALVAIVGIRRFRGREERWHVVLLALGVLGFTAMMLEVSVGIWNLLPLLRFVQFPWRFLGPTSLFLAVLAGAGVDRVLGQSRLLLPLILALVAVFALTWLFPPYHPVQPEPDPIRLITFERETGGLGTTSAGDYLPIWVQELPPADALLPAYKDAAPDFIIPRLAEASLPGGARVVEADYGLTSADLVIDTPSDFTAAFNWYFFPGWRARVDGRPQEPSPVGEHGLLGVAVPAGEHRLEIDFGDTPLRRWALVASGVSLVILLISLGLWRGGKDAESRNLTASWPRAWIPSVVVALALFGLKSAYLDRHETIFRRTRFDGTTVAGVQTSLQVTFGDELVLLGYDLESDRVRGDGAIDLTLYWTAAEPLSTDYSVAVHLVDDQGRLYGQDDSQHPGGYPTSRWEVDGFARDRHRLSIWSGTPPGDYTLLVGVYDVTSGRQLAVRDAGGAPVGTTYSLAPVQVIRPTHPPALDDVAVTREVKTDLTEDVQLLGFDPPPAEVDVGGRLRLTLYWHALVAPTKDYEARLSLVASDGTRPAEERAVPGRASYPTSAWREGDVVRDGRSLLVPAAVSSGDYALSVDLLSRAGEPVGRSVTLMEVSVRAPQRSFEMPPVQHPVSARLGNQATLLGYDLSGEEVAPGQSFTVTLTWRAEATTETRTVAFVHLLDEEGKIVAQSDRTPAGGARPTTGWVPGEVVRDSHRLTLSPDAPAGRYTLAVGMYGRADGERLPVHDERGQETDDRILLPTAIRVR